MKTRSSIMRTWSAALTLALVLSACSGDDPVKLVQSAKDYMAKNDHAAAVIQLKNALQAKPDLAEARFLLGKSWLATGDAAGAQAELEKAKAAGFTDEELTPLLAKAMLAQGQAKKVTDTFDEVKLNQADRQAELLTIVAGAWQMQGQREQADARLTSALAAQPNNEAARLLKARMTASAQDFQGAMTQADEVIKANPQNDQAYRLKGDVLLLGLNRPDDALAAYREAVKISPSNLDAQSNIVRILMSQKKFDEAKKTLAEMEKISPNGPTTLYLQGQVALASKDFKTAADVSEKLLRAAPNSPQILELAGMVAFQANELAKAEGLLAKAVSAAPQLRVARRGLAMTYLRQGQTEKALATLPKDPAELERDPALLSVAGQAYMVSGDQEQAQRYFAKAAELDPKDPAKQTSLALSKFATGQGASGLQDLQAISDHDDGIVADMAMINVLARQKRWDDALKAIAALEKKRPATDPVPNHLRAQILMAKGDVAAAREAWAKSEKISPDFLPAVMAQAGLEVANNQAAEAEKRVEAFLKRKPGHVQATLALAKLKERRGAKDGEIAELLSKAVDAAPNDVVPRQLLVSHHLRHGHTKEALNAAQKAAVALPKSAEVLDMLGQAQATAKEFNQAISTFQKMADLQPTSPTPYIRLASVHQANQDGAAAVQSLRKALSIQPDFLPAQRGLIDLSMRDKKTGDAIAVAKEIQTQRPQDPTGFLTEAEIQSAAGAWASAIAAYDKALSLAPQSSDLAVRAHRARVASGKAGEASAFASDWLHKQPKDAGFLVYMGDRAIAGNDLKTAESYYQKAVNVQPDNVIALNNLAWTAGKNGRSDAIALAEKAVALAPKSPQLLDTLAGLLSAQGQHAKAIQTQKQAVALQPDEGAWQLGLAKIQLQAGDKVAAKAQLTALKQKGEKFSGHQEVNKMLSTL